MQSNGDATHDGVVDISDFIIWKKEYLGIDPIRNADFNCDGAVDVGTDFIIWKRGYLNQSMVQGTSAGGISQEPSIKVISSAGPVAFRLSPSHRSLATNSTFAIDLFIEAGSASLDSAQVYLNYNPALVQLSEFREEPGGIPNTFGSIVQKDIDNGSGRLRFVAVDVSDPRKTITGTVKLGTLIFQAQSNAGQLSVGFDPQHTSVGSLAGSIADYSYVGGTYIIVGPSQSPSPTDIGTATPSAILSSTSTPTPTDGWVFCSYEFEFCSFNGTKIVRFGANGLFLYGSFTNGVSCTRAVFGDPIPGVFKQCFYQEGAIPATPTATPSQTTTVPSATRTLAPTPSVTLSTTPTLTATDGWVFCSNEFQWCSFNGTKIVRFGANGQFVYGSFTNGVSCSNAVFGDPIPGVFKQCFYQEGAPTTTLTATPTLSATASRTATLTRSPSLTATPSRTPTPSSSAVGGRDFALESGSAIMTWRSGSVQSGYAILRFADSGTTILPSAGFLPADAVTFTDAPPVGNPAYCFILLAVATNPPRFIGTSDALCLAPGSRSAAHSPGHFKVQLNQSNLTTITWTSPDTAYDGYSLWVIGDANPIPLVAGSTRTTHDTMGMPACYFLMAMQAGASIGNTDVLCAVPGVTDFPDDRPDPATPNPTNLPSATSTPSPTVSPLGATSSTPTSTLTSLPSPTPAATSLSPTLTSTPTATPTVTRTLTATATATRTATVTAQASATRTRTAVPTPSVNQTPIVWSAPGPIAVIDTAPLSIPGLYGDVMISFDAQVTGGTFSRVVWASCRGQNSPNSAYRLEFSPSFPSFQIERLDQGTVVPLVPWHLDGSVLSGSQVNHVEFTCQGEALSASFNGGPVATAQDRTYRTGGVWIGTTATDQSVANVQITNLVVTPR